MRTMVSGLLLLVLATAIQAGTVNEFKDSPFAREPDPRTTDICSEFSHHRTATLPKHNPGTDAINYALEWVLELPTATANFTVGCLAAYP